MHKLALEKSIWIDAPRERVWTAITDPAQIQKWFSPGTTWKLTEMAVGGKLYAEGYESQAGIIETIDPPRRFTYRYQWPNAAQPLTILLTYTLDEENGGTRVILTEYSLEEYAGKHDAENNAEGWKMALENLKAYISGADLPYPEGL